MSAKFSKVTRHECGYCHKLFKTTRHDCKFDPDKRNCLTCRHCRGQQKGTGGNPYTGDFDPPYFECDADATGESDIETLAACGWNLQCDRWEILPGYKDKTTYSEHLRKIWEENIDKTNNEIKGLEDIV